MALPTLTQIRDGLNTRLATISGVQSFSTPPAQPPLPCTFVHGPQTVSYHEAMGNGVNSWLIGVWAIVSTATPTPESVSDLDGFVSPTGTNSVKAAIEGDKTLGGIASSCLVLSCDGYQIYVTDQQSFFGAEFTVRVIGAA